MEIEGKIIESIPMVEGVSKAGNPWKKKEWVMETLNTQYPRKVKFHVFGDKATTLNFEIGKVYSISFDLESREYNGRWYTDVSCYAMRETGAEGGANMGGMQQMAPQPAYGTPMPAAPQMPQAPMDGDNNDDLPF